MGSMVTMRAAQASHTKDPGRSQATQRVGDKSSSVASRTRSQGVDEG